ncbi:hypothetical protein Tco_1089630 [Tanacetum coccineum]
MAESSSHNPSSPEITPKEEPVTLDKHKSPNPFLPADQVKFSFEEIALTTNNEVALLYPSHPNSEYFKVVSDFISKCCLKEAFTRAPTQYKEYLCEFWYTAKTLDDSKIWVSTPTSRIKGDINITSFRNALRAHYLPHSSMYVPPPSIAVVRSWFAIIRYSGEIGAKGTLKKSFLPPRWRLLMAQIIQCLGGKTGSHDQISNKDAIILYCMANRVKVDYAKLIWEDIIHKLNKKTRLKALKPNQPEGPPFTDHMKAICNIDVPVDFQDLKTSSQTEKVPQGKKPGAKSGLRIKQSSKHTSESKTKASKSKNGQSDKETQSSSAKDKSPSHPSPSTPMVGEMHKEAQQAACGPTSLWATSKEGAHPQLSSGTNLSVLVDKTKSVGNGLKTTHTDLGTNKESKSDEILKKIKLEDLSDLMKDTRSSFFTPDSPQDEPIIVSDESEEVETEKDVATHATSHNIHKDTSLTSVLEGQAGAEKLKTLDGLPSLLNKVTDTLNRFATVVENASGATSKSVPTTVYREDGTIEVIPNVKVSDLHLAEWKEVVQACLDRKEKGWKTIYGLIKTRMEYLNQTEKELKIDFNKPLKEQDPLNELNDLAN